jgi:Transmembrane amino acid transporter protein
MSDVHSVAIEKEEDASCNTSALSSESSYRLQEDEDEEEDVQSTSASIMSHQSSARVQSSNVTAFVTLLKALFGVSLLSSPRVLGETGLLLGTIVYSWIVLACVGACWCLLQARAKVAAEKASQRPSLADSSQSTHGFVKGAITYGDLGRTLLGAKPSVIINFLIVSLHILFGAGLVANSIHQISVVLGWEQDSDENGEEEIWLKGRAILSAIFFPIIATLLQFRNVHDLFWVCLAGIVVFLVGCVGTMLYSSTYVDADGDDDGNSNRHGIWDIPQDALEWKWSGIPNFVASTLCAMEGINLALPIANQFYLINRNKPYYSEKQELKSPIPIVTTAVGVFGVTTLLIAYFGYLSGMGGGSGTKYEDEDNDTEDCPAVAHCLNSELLETIHRVSLTAALVLTLPIILYPSLELLERWAEERQHQLRTGKTSSNRDLGETWNGFVKAPPSESFRRQLATEEAIFGTDPFFPCLHRHWRYRISHAAAVCLLAIVHRPWERVLVLYKGIGLSICCFLLPVILYVRAHSLAFVLQNPSLTAALGGLMALGLVNFVLVILSVFTEHNFLPDEIHDDPLHHHHESQSRSHSHSGD